MLVEIGDNLKSNMLKVITNKQNNLTEVWIFLELRGTKVSPPRSTILLPTFNYANNNGYFVTSPIIQLITISL